ncbi:hypothetical protein Ac2012v2_001947 [Leucoagaricus gongylophorus]
MVIYVLLLLGLLAFFTKLNAQSNVTTCVPDYQWTINHLNQTPCFVAAVLESDCGKPSRVDQIPEGTHYLGPTSSNADRCSCNSVTYSLVEACGKCQNRSQLISFNEWTNECPSGQIETQFPGSFPSSVEVPYWATLDISETGGFFNPNAARAASTSVPLTTSSTQSSETPSSSHSPSSGSSRGIKAGGIAGITVGVLIGVICILLFIFWRMLARRRRSSTQVRGPVDPFNEKQIQSLPLDRVHPRPLLDPTSPAMPRSYSPMDINPGSGSSMLFTAGPVRSSTDDLASTHTLVSPKTIVTSHNVGSGGYTGAPEV